MEISAKYEQVKVFGKFILRFSEHKFIHLSWKWWNQTLWAKKEAYILLWHEQQFILISHKHKSNSAKLAVMMPSAAT